MSDELFDILSNSNKDIDNQKLMDYIHGRLSREDHHDMEKMLADNEFMNDAVEGLRHIKDSGKLQTYIEQLNKVLHKQIQEKKNRRNKHKIKDYPWIYFAIVLVLVFCVIAFIVIRQYLH
jgi:type II secretory pathway component PulF